MSLKHFHIFFIVVAILCTLGFAAFALMMPADDIGGFWGRVGGVISALIGLALIPYGVWFIRKSKTIII